MNKMKINPIIIVLFIITISCNNSSSYYSEKDIDSLELKLGKKISIATDAEITKALMSPDMKFVRSKIAKSIFHDRQQMIDSIFKKYNMANKDEAIKAYTVLQEKGINKVYLKDIALEFINKKSDQ
jgi:hypothetical protein